MTNKADIFIEKIAPAACGCQRSTGGVIPASFTIAQAALESNWGTSGLAVKANNLFGVKADIHWQGDTITLPTVEYYRGEWVTVNAHWRKYANLDECLADHVEFFKRNHRYSKAMQGGHSGIEFGSLVAAAGYATDPSYSDKLATIINIHNLKKYDEVQQ